MKIDEKRGQTMKNKDVDIHNTNWKRWTDRKMPHTRKVNEKS